MVDYAILNLIKKIDEYKDYFDDGDYLNDLHIVDNMINGKIPYDINIVDMMEKSIKKNLIT